MIAKPLPLALLVYVFCACSGMFIERRLVLNSLFKRIILIYALAAGQLTLSIELLSVGYFLTAWNLLLANFAITLIVMAFGRAEPPAERVLWSNLVFRTRRDFSLARKDLIIGGLVGVAAVLFALAGVVAWILVPFNDSYHFEMPRFWMQHQSIFPFPVHNPRITTISFLSEAISLPAFIAFRNDYGLVIATMVAGFLVIAAIYSLARRLGADVFAATAAAAISVGYTTFAGATFTSAAEMLLSGAFFGAALIFLIDAWSQRETSHSAIQDLACSTFLFVMACGAKNPTTLVAPFYLVFLAIGIRKAFPRLTPLPGLKRAIGIIVGVGLLGLICSGVGWNYASNKIYFGEKGMPPLMKSTISHNYRPRDVWTRMCRGVALVAFDTLWTPKSIRESYNRISDRTVRILGGKASLPEDNPYFSFKPGPMKGFGLLGLLFLAPAVAVGCVRSVRALRTQRDSIASSGLNMLAAATLTIALFFMCHLVLRWQSIGMIRLIFPMTVTGGALAALLLKNRLWRSVALGLLILTSAMLSVYWAGLVSRRIGRTEGAFFKAISKLQNDHATVLRCQWEGQPPRELIRREDYNHREIDAAILAGLQQPCALGFIGDENSECLYLFGKAAQNRIVPLVDASNEDQIMNVPIDDLDYVVAADKFKQAKAWAQARQFDQVFTCSGPDGDVTLVFQNAARAALKN
jgi:hypothetical protein